jgi:hypothetical protein
MNKDGKGTHPLLRRIGAPVSNKGKSAPVARSRILSFGQENNTHRPLKLARIACDLIPRSPKPYRAPPKSPDPILGCGATIACNRPHDRGHTATPEKGRNQ